jgi:hypothetical protein
LPLQAGFADEVAGAEAPIAGFNLLLADFAYVPARVGHEAARQIASAVHHQHFEQGNVGAVGFDEGDVGRAGFRLDDDGLKILEVARALQLLFQISERNTQAFGDGR